MVELGLAVRAVAEEADADALPVAATHREGSSGCGETDTIGAVGELMSVLGAVVVDAEPELVVFAALDDLTLTIRLDEDAFFAEADATELLA